MKDYLNYRGDFRNLSKKDLETLFIRLKDYHLKYRDHLGIDSKISFGVELEFQDVLLYYVKKELSKDECFKSWSVHEDKSCTYQIDDFAVGGEISSPILHDIDIDWKILAEVLQCLKRLKARSIEETAFQVHVGAQVFEQDIRNVVNFVKLWCVFEHVIFKFSYGESVTYRPKILYFAHPIAEVTKLKCDRIPMFLDNLSCPKRLGYDKKWTLNFQNYSFLSSDEEVNNDIEIRCANGLLDKNMIQNTIYFYFKLMLYVMNDSFDEDYINYLFQHLQIKEFDDYSKTYVQDVLLLVDLIFDNSLDKINFLKQYIKKDEIVFVR